MTAYPQNPRPLDHSSRKPEVALAPYRWPRWRRWMKTLASFASVIGSFGSTFAAYKNSPNLSLAFAVVAAIVSAVQLILSPEIRSLTPMDPEAHPLPGSSSATDTAAPSLSLLNLPSDISGARLTSSSPSPLPSGSLVINLEDKGKGSVQHRDQIVQTSDKDPIDDGENITELPTLFNEPRDDSDDQGSTAVESNSKRSEESAITTGIVVSDTGVRKRSAKLFY
ncbi:hypothetical protein FB446DRAFT_795139 [Lentinula raphanica]|nr:hypothetical protein FB446DRAFT_795139 [Lentinula raphanica]